MQIDSILCKVKRKWLYIFARYYTDRSFLVRLFPLRTGYPLNLENPQTFNEKIQWLKLYDRKPIYIKMVDKVEAKKYVADIIGREYIVPTYNVYERLEDIDFDVLPEQFVLKCNHDSGGLVICKNKLSFNKNEAIKNLKKAFNRNYYWKNREWPYKDVKPKIIAEKYLTDDGVGLKDYKFYCFNGEPRILYISKGLDDHKTANISFLTMDWLFAPFVRSDYNPFPSLPEKPSKFDEMVAIARRLSCNIPFVRVDLYQVRNQVYFSELTFSPCSGFMPFEPKEWDFRLGSWLRLPDEKFV